MSKAAIVKHAYAVSESGKSDTTTDTSLNIMSATCAGFVTVENNGPDSITVCILAKSGSGPDLVVGDFPVEPGDHATQRVDSDDHVKIKIVESHGTAGASNNSTGTVTFTPG